MKIKPLGVLMMTISLLNACGNTDPIYSSSINNSNLPQKGTINQGNISIFPKQNNGYIGDPMPYFDNGVLNLFYLHDARDGNRGFHPWYLMQTTDFINWDDKKEVIPYVNDYSSQDLALGTGSVIKDKNGLYHAYYTGFNGTGNTLYFEKIQHATSSDLITWTKHPEDGFYGGKNDFRDPYVLYMEEYDEYWMLITTRDNNHGVIALYTSTDLKSWKYDRIFFRNDVGSWNMECPTLIKYNDYWYLSYSEQGANRIVHYRYTKDLSKGWTKPTQDYFDSVGFYAGRIEKAFDRLFAFGWVGTKDYDIDSGNFNWAGNLVTHELIQKDNGELYPRIVKEVDNKLSNKVNYNIVNKSSSTNVSDNMIEFSGKSGYEYLMFDELESKPTKITFSVTVTNGSKFGLTFGASNKQYGPLNIMFNLQTKKIEFYNVEFSKISKTNSQASVGINAELGDSLDVVIVSEKECITIYINNQIALTTRMYTKSNNYFGMFSNFSKVTINNLSFYE
ncbi:TPA: DUF4975 domain-containing protein [bacterium]|nr:DUF4975 domain-containing protein [bacterium]